MTDLSDMSEEALIELFRTRKPQDLLVDNGDDAAAFVPGEGLATVITTDSLVEGVHFDLTLSEPEAVGHKLVAASASDIAAMGATPRWLLISAHLPTTMRTRTVEAITAGIHRKAEVYGIGIIGGNMARTSGPIVLASTVLGEAPPQQLIRRGTSQVGDGIFVTGTLGDAAAGLESCDLDLRRAQQRPEARLREGALLGGSGQLHAMCDVSDGLCRDLQHLLSPEQGAQIQVESLPLSPALRKFAGAAAADFALRGGEDYELLFTAPLAARAGLQSRVACTLIGEVLGESGLKISDGREVPAGFRHF